MKGKRPAGNMDSKSSVAVIRGKMRGFCISGLLVSAVLVGPVSIVGQQVPARDGSSRQSDSKLGTESGATDQKGHPHDNTYVIGNDDVLAVNVWNEKDLTRSITVRSDGKISLPLVGELPAAGQTPLELEIAIGNRLKNYITDPQVTVMVEQVNSRKFNILGEVNRPGAYPLAVPTTIVDAIATAGGFRDFAKKKGVYILRQGPSGSVQRIHFNYAEFLKGKNSAQNIYLEPHDTVIVP